MNDRLTKMAHLERRARLSRKFLSDGHVGGVIDGRAAKKADPDSLIVEFVATTEGVDLDRDVILAGGVDPKSYFFTNKSVFLDHIYDTEHIIGNARRVVPRPNLEGVKQWDVHVRLVKAHPHAALVAGLAADGLIGSSIGFDITDASPPTEDELEAFTKDGKRPTRIIRGWEWIELSITAIPSNVEAQAIGREEAKQALLEDLVTKGRVGRELAADLGWAGNTSRSLWPVADNPLAKKQLVAIVTG